MKKTWIFIICLGFAIIPFLWFRPGQVDLGGDSTRLYFYDPIGFLKSYILNIFVPDSLGIKSGGTYIFPFALLLFFLRQIFQSPYLVITLFNAGSLVISFLTIYVVIKELFRWQKVNHTALTYGALMGGIFYNLVPIASLAGWDLPLILFTERFVYPLIFYFLLRFINSSKSYFLLLAILVSVIFAQNLSWVALPNFIGFFSISVLFLFIYTLWFRKAKVPLKPLISASILFLLLQSFQYFPVISNILEKNSDVNNQLLQGNALADTLHYVLSVVSYTERGYALLGLTPFATPTPAGTMLIIFPLIIVLTLIKSKSRVVIILMLFFLILYYFITGKITNIGFSLFQKSFALPGFVMFRNFYGKWEDTYLFYYALIVGATLYLLFSMVRGYKRLFICLLLTLILAVNAWAFLKGDISNRILTNDTGVVVKSHIIVSQEVKDLLRFMDNYPYLGRNLSFPIADFDYQIIADAHHDGAYFGPSMIAYLTRRTDLGSSFVLRPFIQGLFDKAKIKDYAIFANIFPIFAINTVFYDADPYVYEVFATFPYNEAKEYFPKTEAGLNDFVNHLPLQKIKNIGRYYHIYKVSSDNFLPMIYIPTEVMSIPQNIKRSNYDSASFNSAEYVLEHFRTQDDNQLRKVFLAKRITISKNIPNISFSQISPAKYIVALRNITAPFMLVFSESFNDKWQLFEANAKTANNEKNKRVINTFFDGAIKEKTSSQYLIDFGIFDTIGKRSIAYKQHFSANAYANAWYIKPSELQYKKDVTLILEMTDERVVYLGFIVSSIGLVLYFIWFIKVLVADSYKE